MCGTIVLINHVPNYFHSFSFYLKNLINLLNFFLKIRKKSKKLGKVLEKESIGYCKLLEERSVVQYRQYY